MERLMRRSRAESFGVEVEVEVEVWLKFSRLAKLLSVA
jgi:hypothetical protein